MLVICEDCDGSGAQLQEEWDPSIDYVVRRGIPCKACNATGEVEHDAD